MDFLKKHYEKILLSVVLIALAAAAALLPFKINAAKESLNSTATEPSDGPAAAPLDLSKYTAALERLSKPKDLELSGAHNLFNPVLWKSNQLGLMIKVNESIAIEVKEIRPLHLVLGFDRSAGNGYWIGVTRESAGKLGARPIPKYAKLNEKVEHFTIREAKGSPEEPELIIELNDTKEKVSISKTKSYKRVEGHSADLKHVLDPRTVTDARVNQTVTLGGESYKIIAITQKAVRVQAVSNQKAIDIPWNAAR